MVITEVKTNRELLDFIKLPFRLYRNDDNWIPPLIQDQKKFFHPAHNPYYDHSEVQLFLARRDGKPVGRISAHTNVQHNKFHEDKVGFFGFFETENDQEIARELITAAASWLQKKGCDLMRGPMNFSTNDECGLLVKGFDTPPFVMMPYNKEFYQGLLEKSSLRKSMDLFAYLIPVQKTPEKLDKLAEKLKTRGNFTVRSLNKKNLKEDLETVFTIYRKAWEKNWGFVPLTNREFDHLVKTLLPIIMPEFVYIAEVEGQAAGFSVTLPDYNFILKKLKGRLNPLGILKALYYKNKIPRLRVITMGVIKEFQNRGIDVVFYQKSFETAYLHKQTFLEAEFSWILETNTMMNKIAGHLGGEVHKTYRIYDQKI